MVLRFLSVYTPLLLIVSLQLEAQNLPAQFDSTFVTVEMRATGGALRYGLTDAGLVESISNMASEASETVATFLAPTPVGPFNIVLAPDRSVFTSILNAAWGIEETACWMVGTALGNSLVLLSPGVWTSEACEHDPEDAQHITDILTHELVHLVHMRANPSDGFEGVTGLDWFIEGLAVFAAGQLGRDRLSRAEDAIAEGAAPVELADAWTGQYRYGVSGSLVAYVDHWFGRKTTIELMNSTSLDDLLSRLEVSETELLADWREWAL